VVQQHGVFLLAKKAEDAFDKRLLLAILRDRVRRGKASGEDRIVNREGDEEEERYKPDTRHKETHDLEQSVAVKQA
jgi:hypothetical protein